MALKIPKGHEIFQKYEFQSLPIYTKIWIFGLQIHIPSGDSVAQTLSGYRVRLQNRRSLVRIPPGCKVLGLLHSSAVVIT
jgi:hypothetical protein